MPLQNATEKWLERFMQQYGEGKNEWVCWVVEEEQGKSGEIGREGAAPQA